MKVIAIHVDPQMARQLKILAAETDSTIQQLVEDAVCEKLLAAGKKV
jgi:predicted transcriptional regulator